ncbi:hypothetical protein ABZ442_05105 [Streptomyces triculaminicus]|uniref:hypothetical protein n=1 Tax=Streptomyces triculaminicus TaxID=2816232 RepID=UPI0033CC6A09
MNDDSDLDEFQKFLAESAARPSNAAAAAAAENPLLMAALGMAVPMHMMKLRQFTFPECVEIAHRCSETLVFHGDNVQFLGPHSAEAFNALARGLAALALTADGGVTVAGTHWCRHSGCRDLHGDHHPRYTDLSLPAYCEETS